MIKVILNKYITWLLSYLDTDNGLNQIKFVFVQFYTMGLTGLLGIAVFYYIIGASSILASFIIGAAYGRLLFDWILEKYDKNYPYDKRYTPFLRFIATSTIMFVTFGGTFMLIKDAQENKSVLNEESMEAKVLSKPFDENSTKSSLVLPYLKNINNE